MVKNTIFPKILHCTIANVSNIASLSKSLSKIQNISGFFISLFFKSINLIPSSCKQLPATLIFHQSFMFCFFSFSCPESITSIFGNKKHFSLGNHSLLPESVSGVAGQTCLQDWPITVMSQSGPSKAMERFQNCLPSQTSISLFPLRIGFEPLFQGGILIQ